MKESRSYEGSPINLDILEKEKLTIETKILQIDFVKRQKYNSSRKGFGLKTLQNFIIFDLILSHS